VAGVTIASRLPWLLFSLVAGALADRLDRRRTMVLVDLFRAGLLGALAVATFGGLASLPLLYGIAFALGVAALVVARRARGGRRTASIALAAAASACSAPGPRDIAYNSDACDYCRMTISDERFAAQFITSKGKVHAFDSIECLAAFYLAGRTPTDRGDIWVSDFAHPGRWVAAERAVFARSKTRQSPMGLDLRAFAADADTAGIARDTGATILRWSEVLELVRRERLADANVDDRRLSLAATR
jgi:copper chaperone NosL